MALKNILQSAACPIDIFDNQMYNICVRITELAGTTEEVIREEIRFEKAVESYIAWFRGVHIVLITLNYEDKDGKERAAIIIDIDGVPLDIADKIDDIIQMAKEHFKLLAKQFGKSIDED